MDVHPLLKNLYNHKKHGEHFSKGKILTAPLTRVGIKSRQTGVQKCLTLLKAL